MLTDLTAAASLGGRGGAWWSRPASQRLSAVSCPACVQTCHALGYRDQTASRWLLRHHEDYDGGAVNGSKQPTRKPVPAPSTQRGTNSPRPPHSDSADLSSPHPRAEAGPPQDLHYSCDKTS